MTLSFLKNLFGTSFPLMIFRIHILFILTADSSNDIEWYINSCWVFHFWVQVIYRLLYNVCTCTMYLDNFFSNCMLQLYCLPGTLKYDSVICTWCTYWVIARFKKSAEKRHCRVYYDWIIKIHVLEYLQVLWSLKYYITKKTIKSFKEFQNCM